MYIRHRWRAFIAALLAVLICAAPAMAAKPSDYNKNMPQVLEAGHLYGETVVTGRYPPESLYEKADYVSEIIKRRHPFDKGISARAGVEF